MIIPRSLHGFNLGLLLLVVLIPAYGLLVLGSAGFDPDTKIVFLGFNEITIQSRPFLKQATFLLAGMFLIGAVVSISPRFWHRTAYWVYGLAIFLLIFVFLFGAISKGSRRWIPLGSFNLQPSEFAKVAVILALGRYLSKYPPRKQVYGVSELVIPFLIVLLPMVLILEQPDLGTSLVLGAIGFSMILFMGVQKKVLIGLLVIGVGTAAAAWNWILRPYQKTRVLTMLNAESDPQGSGWHIIQSKIAVGSGELFGKGYLKGSQGQLEFLPERTTDFIFCVLSEEFGFLGSSLLLALYVLLLFSLLRQMLKFRDTFPALVTLGMACMIFYHTIVNLGMVLGFLPVVGIPLPLFSYGGSSLIITIFGMGIVLGMGMRRSVLSKR